MQALNTLVEYQRWTASVHVAIAGQHVLPLGARLSMAALGICGELGELKQRDADTLIEAGDVLSYVMLAATFLGLSVGGWVPEELLDQPHVCASIYPPAESEPLQSAVDHALAFAEMTKKRVFQGRDLPEDAAAAHLQAIVLAVAAFLGTSGCSMRQVLVANTIKLESRYPKAASHTVNKGESDGGEFE